MKKIFTLIAMTVLALSMNAEMYIVGNDPFGGWHTCVGQQMTDNGDGTYSWTGQISGTIWFVFADGLTEYAEDAEGNPIDNWDQFNNEYRYCPLSDEDDQVVKVGDVITTQKRAGAKSYKFAALSEGSEYTITINTEDMEFWIDGEQGDSGFKSFTVAGTPTSVFGTEWNPADTENDMTQNEEGLWVLNKYYCLVESGIAFKVVANHDWGNAWPANNYEYYVDKPGYYDLQFTFDSVTYAINVIAELKDTVTPEPPEPIEAMYVLGEVNGNTWLPNMGVAMTTEDMVNYTIDVEATGEKVDAEDGQTYSFFSFTSKLAEGAEDWGAISGSRLGAIEDGCLVSEDMLGMPLSLIKGENSFKVPSGKKYSLAVNVENLEAMTVTITEKSDGVDELAAGKTVSDVRYFNVMGQEMSEANGVTIVVTRYTDGSTTAAKVIK